MKVDKWFSDRMSQIRCKELKKPCTRVANLRKLRIRPDMAYQTGMSSRAYGRIAKSPILHRALPTEHWAGHCLNFVRAPGIAFK